MDPTVFAGLVVAAVAIVSIFARRDTAVFIFVAISAVAGAVALFKSYQTEESLRQSL